MTRPSIHQGLLVTLTERGQGRKKGGEEVTQMKEGRAEERRAGGRERRRRERRGRERRGRERRMGEKGEG